MPVSWLIREMPEGERPRERLLKQGSGALSDTELVAVLLRTGRAGVSAVDLARELLQESGGLSGLLAATPQSLKKRGIGPAKKAALLAALEIARRLAWQDIEDQQHLRCTSALVRYLNLRYGARDQEILGALFLNTRHRLLGEREIFRGTIDRAAVEPQEILKECLLRGARGVVIFHTHPSGDPSPSLEDMEFTRNLAEAAVVVGIRLVDHLVLGRPGRWASLRERMTW